MTEQYHWLTHYKNTHKNAKMQCFRHHNLFPLFWISILKNWFIFGEQNHFCFRIWQNIASRLNITYWKWVKKIVLFLGLCKLFFLYSFFWFIVIITHVLVGSCVCSSMFFFALLFGQVQILMAIMNISYLRVKENSSYG